MVNQYSFTISLSYLARLANLLTGLYVCYFSFLVINSHALFIGVEILAELNEWGPVFTLWSNSEDKLSGPLSGMAKAVEKCYVALQELVSYCVFFCVEIQTINVIFNCV